MENSPPHKPEEGERPRAQIEVGLSFEELLSASISDDGIGIDLHKMVKAGLEGGLGHVNGGKRCDVTSGPCSCGAWH